MLDNEEEEDVAKVFRKQKVDAALDEAMSRVLSMVDSPDARQQYRRMLERYRQAMVTTANINTINFERSRPNYSCVILFSAFKFTVLLENSLLGNTEDLNLVPPLTRRGLQLLGCGSVCFVSIF